MRKTVAAACIFAGAALPFAAATAQPIPPEAVGTYEVVVAPDPNKNACGLTPAVNIGTFGKDGTLVNVDPFLGTAVGQIYKGAKKTYYSSFFGIAFNPLLNAIVRYEVQGVSTLSTENGFSGTFDTTITFPDQTTCTSSGTFTGTRLAGSRL